MDRRFLILQTDDYDFKFESGSEKDAEHLMGLLSDLMRDNNHGKYPCTFRGMHLSATDEGADDITPDISRELFGTEIIYCGGLNVKKKAKETHYRIVKEENLSLDGGLKVVYYPEYKGIFGWNRFVEYNIDNCSTCAGFDDYDKAKAFIDNVTRMKGLSQKSVVAEFVYEQVGDKE